MQNMLGVHTFLSVQNVLKHVHHLTIRKTRGSVSVEFRGAVGSSHPDDKLSTVAGHLLEQAVALYPKLQSLQRAPVVSMGPGYDFLGFLSDFNYGEFEERVISKLDTPEWADYVAAYNDANSLVTDKDGKDKYVENYEMMNAIYVIFLRLREHPVDMGPGDQLPDCSSLELGDVLSGKLKRSVSFSTFPSSLAPVLLGVHPDGEVLNDRFVLREAYDPFKLIGGSRKDTLNLKEIRDDLERQVKYASPVARAVVEEVVDEPLRVDTPCQDMQAAVDLFVEFDPCGTKGDFNSLSPADRIRYQYGSTVGMKAWMSSSKSKRSNIWAHFPIGYSAPKEQAIEALATGLMKFLPKTVELALNDVTDEMEKVSPGAVEPVAVKVTYKTVLLLAVGRFLSSKSAWEFGLQWCKLH